MEIQYNTQSKDNILKLNMVGPKGHSLNNGPSQWTVATNNRWYIS